METSEELQKFNEKLQNNSKPRVSLFFVLKDKKRVPIIKIPMNLN